MQRSHWRRADWSSADSSRTVSWGWYRPGPGSTSHTAHSGCSTTCPRPSRSGQQSARSDRWLLSALSVDPRVGRARMSRPPRPRQRARGAWTPRPSGGRVKRTCKAARTPATSASAPAAIVARSRIARGFTRKKRKLCLGKLSNLRRLPDWASGPRVAHPLSMRLQREDSESRRVGKSGRVRQRRASKSTFAQCGRQQREPKREGESHEGEEQGPQRISDSRRQLGLT